MELTKEEKIYWLKYCYNLAKEYSDDKDTQIGAIILNKNKELVSFGVNRLCKNVKYTTERITRPLKYSYISHAEANACHDLAYNFSQGLLKYPTNYSPGEEFYTMICPFFSCDNCGKIIIETGIKHIIGHKDICDIAPNRWKEPIEISLQMFKESGVTFEYVEGKIDPTGKTTMLFDRNILQV